MMNLGLLAATFHWPPSELKELEGEEIGMWAKVAREYLKSLRRKGL